MIMDKKVPGFHPTPQQEKAKLLIQSGKKYILLAGGSRSGKTAFLCYALICRAYDCKSRHAILRFHFNDVKRSVGMDTLPKILKMTGVSSSLNKSDWVYTIQTKDGDTSEIWLGGLDDKERVEKVLGNEYSTVYLNEASQISYHAYSTALTRLAENSGHSNKVFIDCNPPEKSHWLYQLFVAHKQPGTSMDLVRPDLYGWLQMNPADNPYLPKDYIKDVLETLPERQKKRFLYGEWLDHRQGSLWTSDVLEKYRVNRVLTTLTYAGIAIDPAVSAGENSDETGIVWGGMDSEGEIFILGDLSLKGTPYQWASCAVDAYSSNYLDFVAGEVNQGGDMVASTIKSVDSRVNFIPVRATRGKALRAEPVVALYEQGKVHHVGYFPELEEQMTGWSPEDRNSPDRLDALVWLVTVLLSRKHGGCVPSFYGLNYCSTPHMTNWQKRPPVFGNGWYR